MIKNIAILIPNLQSGGSERIAAGLSEVLAEKYNVYTVLFDTRDISYKYGGRLVDLNLPAVSGKAGKAFNMLKRIFALRKLVKKEKIDIVCSFTSAADNANAFSKAKAKRLVSCRGALFLKENMSSYKKMCKSCDGILFNSEGMREMYLEKYPEDEAKAFVLYNLFDIERIRAKAEEPVEGEIKTFTETHKTVVAVGRFVPEKGQWHLIKAFEILKEAVPDAGLLFVGHLGSLEEKIREMAANSKYSTDIMFAGYTDNPFKLCKNSAIYAMSSAFEGFPNSLVEAMAVGTPVVSTDCLTGPREILFNAKPKKTPEHCFEIADCGIITPPFDGTPDFDNANKTELHRIYAKALEKMLTDGDLAKKCAFEAAKKSEKLDWHNMMEKYENLFGRL